jgi:small-conductance mechanosensitive channel
MNSFIVGCKVSDADIRHVCRSILGNVASAVTLFASPPFAVGDKVKFVEPNIEGTVLSIAPMKTTLRLDDGAVLYVQNAKVVNWMVVNRTAKA